MLYLKDGEKLIHPSAVVVNDNDDIFVKDDRAIYVFDKRGNPINVIGKRCFKHPYGKIDLFCDKMDTISFGYKVLLAEARWIFQINMISRVHYSY